LLLNDVIFILLSDEMLFTLTTLKRKIWRMAFGTAKNKTLVQERFFRARMTFS